MSSNIPGFSHDVFISYRQKDNVPWAGNTKSEKVKGWVTEFVDALKAELKSTSGEDISIYFDGNLQEELSKDQSTDKSHRDQVKSVLFLPILSRTYCDPGSFPWRHELLGFLSHTVEDNVGLKEKLPQGQVSSRIVPVRIHDLPLDDLALLDRKSVV